MRAIHIIVLGGMIIMSAVSSSGFEAVVSVDAGNDLGEISQHIYGHFIEHLGRCINQGIWAEILKNRKFWGVDHPDYGVPSPWRAEGKTDGVSYLHDNTVFYSGGQSQRIKIEHDGVRAGIRQESLDLRGNLTYHLRLVARHEGLAAPVRVELVKGGQTLPSAEISLDSQQWKTYNATLEVTEPAADVTFRITTAGPGTLWLGAVSLMPGDAVAGMRSDVIEAIRRVKPANVRWPGGNFVSGYHWKDGTGDRDRRPTRMDRAWNAPEPNDFGIDEFIQFCRLVDTEPYVVVNSGDGDAEEATDLVQYCNGSTTSTYGALRARNGHPDPYGVWLWGVGNEMYGGWQIGHVDAETYAQRHVSFAKAMMAEDPTITLVGVGEGNPRWDEAMFQIAGNFFDMYSYHHYTGDIRNPDQYSKEEAESRRYWHIVGMPVWLDGKFDELAKFVTERKPKGKEIGLAFDEWNVWLPEVAPGIEQDYRLREAIYAAGVFHALHRHNDSIPIANLAQLVNVLGAIKTTQTDVALTPIALAFELYTRDFGTKRVACNTSSPTNQNDEREVPLIDASAAITDDGRALTLSLINRHPTESAKISLEIKGWKLKSKAEVSSIAGENYLSGNVPGKADEVTIQKKSTKINRENPEIELGPHAVSLYRFEK
ncbi:MAG: alpha-L-arabinofuranosidase C-terminal domain-containing protein [bacterium]